MIPPADAHERQRLAESRQRCAWLGPASSVRTLFEAAARPLFELMGFGSLRDVETVDSTIVATVDADGENLLLLVSPWGERLDPLWRHAIQHAAIRAAGWCALFNGARLRLFDSTRPFSRRYVEFDLDAAADDDRAFLALWFVVRRLPAALRALVQDSDRHAAGVCRSLKDGVLQASTELVGALVEPRAGAAVPLARSFEQTLTIVYRILFLLFAEARGLVPIWHPIYRESYSMDALRALAEQPHRAVGLWESLRAAAHLVHEGCRAGDLHVTPFNGRLFSPSRTPLAERRDVNDEAVRRALLALSTQPAPDRGGAKRIAYRDLGVEQLGAVYETLLDYRPTLDAASKKKRPAIRLEPGSGIRKATGTFYTPRSITDYLVRRTLAPLVHDAAPECILRLRIVDPAMGSGAFLVAACRYLAQAYEASLVRSGTCHPSDIGERERVSIRRSIAERCLYGVDVNPAAVQLARLSLWLTTLAADRPLTFLDHRLHTGDSLLGARFIDLGRPLATGRRRKARDMCTLQLFDEPGVRTALRDALPVRFALESIPNETLDAVRAKERALGRLNSRETALSRWKLVANVWCSAWFSVNGRSVPASAFSTLADRIVAGAGGPPDTFTAECLRLADEVAAARRFFHWELECPEVFFDPDGTRPVAPGFDAVLGNPPWDMVRADAGSREVRRGTRSDVDQMLAFTRRAGVYTARSSGHPNLYQLFTERAMALVRPAGRIGLVLPSGLAIDHGSAQLRQRLLSECDVDTLVGFDNRAGLFPIHRSVRFLLLTATAGSPTRSIACRLGERDPSRLESLADNLREESAFFSVRLTPGLIQRLSGDSLVIPELRTTRDLAIAERAATLFPPLGSEQGWGARFGRELNATDDRGQFSGPGEGLPIVEGKHISPFRVHVESARQSISTRRARRLLDPARFERPRLGYRDVAGSTNRLTLIAAVLPSGCVSTHTIFCLRTPLPPVSQHFLCGLFNSFVVNYLVRMRVSTHVTTATVERLPIPGFEESPRRSRRIAALARRLVRRDDTTAFARLQVLVAELYRLSCSEFAHVLDTFPLIPKKERDGILQMYVGPESR